MQTESYEISYYVIFLIEVAAFSLSHTKATALEERERSRGLLVLPLPTTNDAERPVFELLCFGGLSKLSNSIIRNVATECGLTLEAITRGSLTVLNENYLLLLGQRLLSRFLIDQGWCRILDDVYTSHTDLFPRYTSNCSEKLDMREEKLARRDFVEAVKVVVLLNTRTTNPWREHSENANGQIGLTISLEPMVFKRIRPPFDDLKLLATQHHVQQSQRGRLMSSQNQQDNVRDEHGVYSGRDVFPPDEAVLEMRAVKVLPDLTKTGFLVSLPTQNIEITPLEKINTHHGFDAEVPRNEVALRRFWRLTHGIELPAEPLTYVRVIFEGQGRASTIYPTLCLVSQFVHNYSRTTQAYSQLCQTFLRLLRDFPSVLRLSTDFSSSSGGPVGRRLSSPENPGLSAFKTARQLRDSTKVRRPHVGDNARLQKSVALATQASKKPSTNPFSSVLPSFSSSSNPSSPLLPHAIGSQAICSSKRTAKAARALSDPPETINSVKVSPPPTLKFSSRTVDVHSSESSAAFLTSSSSPDGVDCEHVSDVTSMCTSATSAPSKMIPSRHQPPRSDSKTDWVNEAEKSNGFQVSKTTHAEPLLKRKATSSLLAMTGKKK
jgi:hypothetical protein